MALNLTQDGIVETLLCELGRLVLFLSTYSCYLVAHLFGFDPAPIIAARDAIATAACPS